MIPSYEKNSISWWSPITDFELLQRLSNDIKDVSPLITETDINLEYGIVLYRGYVINSHWFRIILDKESGQIIKAWVKDEETTTSTPNPRD